MDGYNKSGREHSHLLKESFSLLKPQSLGKFSFKLRKNCSSKQDLAYEWNPFHCLFLQIKFWWNTAMPICLPHTIYGWFHVTIGRIKWLQHKSQNIYQALHKNSFSTTVLEESQKSLYLLLHSIQKQFYPHLLLSFFSSSYPKHSRHYTWWMTS